MSNNEHTVILGGGVIGLSIAYHLSQEPDFKRQIHIVDSSTRLLESASGYAGGFLARDWFLDPVAALGDLSFQLHRQLADKYQGQKRWGYAGSHVYSLDVEGAPEGGGGVDWLLAGTSRAQAAAGRRTYGHVSGPEEAVNEDGTPAWITPQVGASWGIVSSVEDCAQVEPRRLCEFLLSECRRMGVRFHLGTRATRVEGNASGEGSILELEANEEGTGPDVLHCSDIIIAAGCWTPRVFQTMFPQSRIKVEIDSLAGHSVLYKSPRYVKPFLNVAHGIDGKAHSKDENISYAIYCPQTKDWSYAPEAYARLNADGAPEIWVGGLNHDSTEIPLPELATDAKKLINKESIAGLRKTAVQLTGLKGPDSKIVEDDLEVITEALCFRPVSKSGVPIIGEVSSRDLYGPAHKARSAKVWIASGALPRSISLSLGTGAVMSDLLLGRESRVDISGMKVESPVLSKL